MTRNQVWQAIILQTKKDKKDNPHWPDHVVAQAGMINKAAGMLTSSSIDLKYNPSNIEEEKKMQRELLIDNAVKTAVSAIRFLENLK